MNTRQCQRAYIAAKIADLPHGGDRRSDQAANRPVVTQAAAGEMLNVSERSVRRARKVIEQASPEVRADASIKASVTQADADQAANLPHGVRPEQSGKSAALTFAARHDHIGRSHFPRAGRDLYRSTAPPSLPPRDFPPVFARFRGVAFFFRLSHSNRIVR